jgi:putative ABC transport system ATP-binding protein
VTTDIDFDVAVERATPRGAAVSCEGVVHIYPGAGKDIDDVVALRGVDLDVDAGEVVALLGPSGSGKSTVLGLLAGVLRPSAGRVLVGGHDIGRMPPRALAKLRGSLVATVLQDPGRNLLPYASVLQNVRFGASAARDADATRDPEELIERLGLADFSDRIAGRLSGGEQQRAAIVAAVASGAGLLLADEPTSYLDAAGRSYVMELLEQVNREFGTTVIVVTHDEVVAAAMDRTVTIRDGRVGAEGRHGNDYAVIGRDGSLQLPPDVIEQLPPGTLLEVIRRPDGVDLRTRETSTDIGRGAEA